MALAACHAPRREARQMPTAAPGLAAIDSLSWAQPDSALALLLPWFDTRRADTAPDASDTTLNRHYANLLLAELLYKNEYAQTNRDEVQQAVDYFDSLADTPTAAFLAARAHYINGVGHYEQESVEEACNEYINALETMERRFDERELVGKRARFMAYTYNRLGDMFSEHFLSGHAITCYKQSLSYCRRQSTSKYGIPVLLYSLGILYDIANQHDSAAFYYGEALANMPDSDNVHYRDLSVSMVLFGYYSLECGRDSLIYDLEKIAALSADDDELTTRLLTIGNVLFDEKQYDSSLVYLETAFERKEDITSKMMAAEKLAILYQQRGDSMKAQGYASFLAGFTMSEIERKTEASEISETFMEHLARRQEKQAEEERKRLIKSVIKTVIPIAVAVTLLAIFLLTLKHKKLLKRHSEEAERTHGETEQEYERELQLWQAEAEKALEAEKKRHREALETQKGEAMRQARSMLPQRVADLYRSKLPNRLERIMDEFEAAYPQALEQLAATHPSLNEVERKIAVLNFLRFRSKEEAGLTGFTENTTLKYRSNLKKKAGSNPISDLIADGKI